jgi:hypothetical protein
MTLHKWPRSILKQAYVPPAESSVSSNTNEEYDREYQDFIESISMTAEELAAFISMPELSMQEVKQYLHAEKNSSPKKYQSSLGCAVPQPFVERRRAENSDPRKNQLSLGRAVPQAFVERRRADLR